ncbi:hypothetical protein BCR42DRAFT_410963 [Absidia repens]|uniref:Transmembrane protein n=1 Tax=Absidia repens TaxID=90262 RepID=A0A1X2IL52_9FUNG|nr:hypothetical protein BCR42DRAFT_410963 [Absidia repens]
MENDAGVLTAIQTGTIQQRNLEDVNTSPPHSPPPVQILYTDGPIDRGPIIQPIAALPTRRNKANLGKTGSIRKRQPLLLPKPIDLPPSACYSGAEKKDSSNMSRTKIQRWVVYVLGQLLKRNNLVLLINCIHHGWRSRFFLARSIQLTYRTLGNYPYYDEYRYYRDTVVQLGKVVVLMAKKDQRDILVDMAQRQNKRRAWLTLRVLVGWIQVYMVVTWSRLMNMSGWGLKAGFRVLKFFSAWDSLALAFVSVAITRSFQRPTQSM